MLKNVVCMVDILDFYGDLMKVPEQGVEISLVRLSPATERATGLTLSLADLARVCFLHVKSAEIQKA